MLIRSFEKAYEVLGVTNQDKDVNELMCREVDSLKVYILYQIKEKKLMVKAAPFFYKQVEKKEYEDFQETFIYNGSLYVVMVYYEADTKNEFYLDSDFLERMETGKLLLQKILVEKVPFYIRCQCLGKDAFFYTKTRKLQFQYKWDNLMKWDEIGEQEYLDSLYQWFDRLFKEEIKAKRILPILSFVEQVRAWKPLDDLFLYQEYVKAMQETESLPQEQFKESENFLVKWWHNVKKYLPVIRKVFAVVLVMVAVGVAVYGIMQDTPPDNQKVKGYNSIGTLKVE